MTGFWVGSWLHGPPGEESVHGRRVLLSHLCFGPLESREWFVTEEDRFFYEEHILEGCQAGETLREARTREELLEALDHEMELCVRFHGEALLPLLQAERDRWAESSFDTP